MIRVRSIAYPQPIHDLLEHCFFLLDGFLLVRVFDDLVIDELHFFVFLVGFLFTLLLDSLAVFALLLMLFDPSRHSPVFIINLVTLSNY